MLSRLIKGLMDAKASPAAAAPAAHPPAPIEKFRFVVATREPREAFAARTATGRSLEPYLSSTVELRLFPSNTDGLAKSYNLAIEEARSDPAVLIFMHDDVHILDFHWPQRIVEALARFDVMGVAGTARRLPHQPAWCFIDNDFTWDDSGNLSGAVGDGNGFPAKGVSYFGESPRQVKLLDGLMFAARSATLVDSDIRFDEQFDFHFYDMDFCREAERKGLTLGTWPLALIHESPGNFLVEGWALERRKYFAKWGD